MGWGGGGGGGQRKRPPTPSTPHLARKVPPPLPQIGVIV